MKKLIGFAIVLAAIMAGAQGKAPPRPKHPALPPEERMRVIAPAKPGELRLVPSFTSVSVCYGCDAEVQGLSLEYRKVAPSGFWKRLLGKEEPWLKMEFGCPWFADVKNHRGSVYVLEENTDYEIRLASGGRTVTYGRTRTWSSDVPIAKTVEIDPATAKFPIIVSDCGTANGWVRYAVKGGRLEAPRTVTSVLFVTNAAYVVFDGLTVRGGDDAAIRVVDSRFVRIRGCDIADWGDDGYEPRYDRMGNLAKPWNPKKRRYGKGSSSGGITLDRGAYGVVVERCYIHEPHSRAHSWRYSHPYGPMAVLLRDSAGGHVLRWNDFVGCDAHRFDDTVGGGNDFYELGTFNRDSDIYGNFIAFANDDCLEIDGGQQNVRVFGNRFEAGFMGVSVQGNQVSPSYVFDNVFTGCVEEFDQTSSSIKVSGIDLFDYRPRCYIFDNVLWGRGIAAGLKILTAKLEIRRNVSYGPEQAWTGLKADGTVDRSPYTVFADNRTNLVATACPSGDWPRRPIPYVTDISRIDGVRLVKGAVSPASAKVTLTCGGKGYRLPFEVVMNDATAWVKVSPAHGVIESGKTVVFDVSFDAAKMAGLRLRRAAFMIRTADGFSRAVTVYGETDYEQPFACERPGETAIYAKVDPKNPYGKYSFDVPKDGRYYFMIRARKNELSGTGRGKLGNPVSDSCLAGVDGEELDRVTYQLHDWSSWMVVSPGGTYMSWIRYYDLKKGVHTLELKPNKGGAAIEGLVLTDAPGSFEPERNKFGR